MSTRFLCRAFHFKFDLKFSLFTCAVVQVAPIIFYLKTTRHYIYYVYKYNVHVPSLIEWLRRVIKFVTSGGFTDAELGTSHADTDGVVKLRHFLMQHFSFS